MAYAYWEKENNVKKYLERVNLKKEIKQSGIPVIYEGDNCYINENSAHTLVVGSTGSGKTQTVILPLIKLSMLASESLVINDVKGELYNKTAKEFKKRGYNIIVLDFDNAKYGNYYNPLSFPYKIYKEGNSDRALNVVESIGYYLFSDKDTLNLDPFWINSATDYFTGLCLYLFNKDKEPSLKDVFDLAVNLSNDENAKKFLKEIEKENGIYYNVSGTLEAPSDTRGGIIATFSQKLKKYISKEKLSGMLSKSDFDIADIVNKKTVLYIVSGYYDYSNNLIPLLINQLFEVINLCDNKNKINIILDEFDRLIPIKNFTEIMSYSRSIGISYTVVIKSYLDLINTYGEKNAKLLSLCFNNYIYLYANDINTLEGFSKLCGNKCEGNKIMPLVSVEELKSIEKFEAIFLLPRLMPFKGKLVPDYKIDWGYSSEDTEFEERK